MNRFHSSLAALAFLAPTVVLAGGPDIEFRSGQIHHVEADEAKIILIVSGVCHVFVADPDKPGGEGSAKYITTEARRAVLTIARHDSPGHGYENWDDPIARFRNFEGKKGWLQLHGGIVIRKNRVAEVAATAGIVAEARK